jgi:hypothetical protein
MAESADPKFKAARSMMVKGCDGKFLAIQSMGSHARYIVSIHNPEGIAETSMVIDEETGFQLWEWLGHTMEFFTSVDLDHYKV